MATKKPEGKTVYAVKHSDYVSPTIEDVTYSNKKYVTWGNNNSYWKFLNTLANNSPSNQACLNGITRLAYGDGLVTADGLAPAGLLAKMSERDIKKTFAQFVKTNKISLQVEYRITETGREISGVFFESGDKFALCKKNEDNEIPIIYFCDKSWKDRRTKKIPYPAFGYGTEKDEIEIFFYDKAHESNSYYGPVDYQGGLQYAELEIETANYHLNLSHNGFTPSALINLNNGIPQEHVRKEIIDDILEARTGSSNAGKIVVLFNRDGGSAATIEPYNIPDAHKQYEFIADESMQKIFLAHNITSPLLLGIRDTGGGLGSNKDEMLQAYELFNLMVLEPIRQCIIEALQSILPKEMVGLEFKQFDYFTTPSTTPDPQPEPNIVMKSVEVDGRRNMTADEEKFFLDEISKYGEIVNDEDFLLLAEEDAGNDFEQESQFLKSYTAHRSPTASDDNAEEKSQGDAGLYMIRYAYGPQRVTDKTRPFCRTMVDLAKQGTVYRLEDIKAMSDAGVNGQFAPQGQSSYDLFAWKGGAYCHHRWFRRVYFRKRNTARQFLPRSKSSQLENEKRITVAEARRAGVPTNKINPNGWDQASTKPIDTPNRGSLKNS